ncbi:serine hydrolase [Ornithinibacillus sp. L9]|uniref:Serine hydrolase n=1 Tax=Ornithinibacillus caprae TaxID=2678566 RepID=A0A6N8FM05_9BACI|nr:serine hydrolase [Ornithinibacillus caprae]MUK89027.1 serine hydrolase [Ornithinibacillus caprae]
MIVKEKIHLLESQFRKMVQKDNNVHNAYLLVHSDRKGIHVNLAEGITGEMKATANQPYYVASVGKMFTAVVVAKLVEEGNLSYEDFIARYLDEDMVQALHVYEGTDYTYDIKVKHLLNHTAGIHDFFEDKPKEGKPIVDLLLEEPDRYWTPRDAIQWSKENLTSHFPPGEGFHYSDTGYHLLGLVIEQVTGEPFQEVLKQYIFQPLGMKNSYLLHYSTPIQESNYPMADVFINDNKATNYRCLSIDYAGGGVVASSKELLRFMKAVVNHEILSKEALERMHDWAKFAPGIDYGYGIMKFKSTPLVLPKRYNMWGNAGITGTFMFYHPELETYFVGSLNNYLDHRKGIKMVFKMVDALMK